MNEDTINPNMSEQTDIDQDKSRKEVSKPLTDEEARELLEKLEVSGIQCEAYGSLASALLTRTESSANQDTEQNGSGGHKIGK